MVACRRSNKELAKVEIILKFTIDTAKGKQQNSLRSFPFKFAKIESILKFT